MAKLVWGAEGTRLFETGIDNVALYLPEHFRGVPWSGVVSINETTSNAEPEAHYIDGHKYLNLMSKPDFSLSLSAYATPEEFASCDGYGMLRRGLMIDEQPRTSFGLSYRTLVGNDVLSHKYGYKIHMLHDVIATSDGRDHRTISTDVTPTTRSWKMTTLPQHLSQNRSASHFIVDSRKTDPIVLAYLELLLYGGQGYDARLLSPDDLVTLFDWEPEEFPTAVTLIGHWSDSELPTVARPGTAYIFEDSVWVRAHDNEWEDFGTPPAFDRLVT